MKLGNKDGMEDDNRTGILFDYSNALTNIEPRNIDIN